MKRTFNPGLVFVLIALLLVSPDVVAEHKSGIFPDGQKPEGWVFALSGFLGLFSALAVHELGHLIAGLAQGFRFELFVVFLLGVKRTEKGIQFYLNRNLGYMGGVAATVPTKKDPNNRIRFAFMVLAGPIASLLFAIICYLAVTYTKNELSSFWLFAGTTSIGVFLATTIPSKSGIFFTDRARFQRLISRGPEGRSEEAILNIIAQTTADNSSRNISLEDARLLQTDKEPFMQFWGHYYECEFYKANENAMLAEQSKLRLMALREAVSKPVWKALKIEE